MESRAPVAPARPGCLAYLLFAAAAAWVATVSAGVQGAAWLVDQVQLIQGVPLPAFAWPAASWAQAALIAIPVVPLAILTRAPRLRAAYQTWAIAAAFLAVLALVRFLPRGSTQVAALGQIVLGGALSAALIGLMRRRRPGPEWEPRSLVPPLALAPVVAVPWLAFGALGSPLDAALSLLAAAAFGLFAGLLLGAFLVGPVVEHSSAPGWDIAFGGFAASVALLVLGSGFGFPSSQLLLMAALPPLGFAAVASAGFASAPGRRWLPVAALVGSVAAAPLMLFDPYELLLLLTPDDVPSWAARAAALSLLLALGLGIALWLVRNRIAPPSPRPRAWLGGLALAWLGALLVYALAGRPGFYGERLFVVLRDQADVQAARTIPDRGERTQYVYTTLTRHADATQADLRATLDGLRVSYRPYYLVNALEVNGGPLLRAYLARRPEVDRVLDSPHLRPLPAPPPVQRGSEPRPDAPPWNVTSIGADRVWRELGVTGKGIAVGQSDSGVQGDHPALRDGYRGRDGQNDYNWLDPWAQTTSPVDFGGHGTHTLGSVLGRGGIGVAPDAEWFACVNLERNLGNPALYLDCLQFMLAPYPQGGDPFRDGDPRRAAHVTNNSWGCPPLEGCDATSLAPATRALHAAGIFVAASAGNEGPRCASVSDPIAIYQDAFSVGAVDRQGAVASFSSRGPVEIDGSGRAKPDIVAPGVDVLSAYPQSTYETVSGTSMAGPHVAGVVALMWSAQPKLVGDVDTTERLLVETARPYTGPREGCFAGGVPNDAFGYGLLDAYAAVKAALALR